MITEEEVNTKIQMSEEQKTRAMTRQPAEPNEERVDRQGGWKWKFSFAQLLMSHRADGQTERTLVTLSRAPRA